MPSGQLLGALEILYSRRMPPPAGRVFITGSSALATSVARDLAAGGTSVVLHALPGSNAATHGGAFDLLSDPLGSVADAERLAARCWESFGPLHGLVVVQDQMNADSFADSDDDWNGAIRTALKLPFFLTRAVASRMAGAGGGCIVNVFGPPADSLEVNDVTRSAGLTMTEALAKALPKTIRVCAVTTDSGDPQAVAHSVRFLLADHSLASGTVLHLGNSGR